MISDVYVLMPTTSVIEPNNMNTSTNHSEILERLQRQTNLIMAPTVAFLSVVALVGVTGNCLVLFVYTRRFSETPLRILIISMAAFDIVTNTVVIPGEIYDSYNFWDFNKPLLCQIRQYVNASAIIASNLILLAIAVTRYRKICRPFCRQVDVVAAKVISVVVAVIAMIFSTPYAIIHGSQKKRAPQYPEVEGHFCEVDDRYKDTIWPTINSGFFIFIFLVLSVALVVLYGLIRSTASKHKAIRKGHRTKLGHETERSTLEFTMSFLAGAEGNRGVTHVHSVPSARLDYSQNEIRDFADENSRCLSKQTFRTKKEKLNVNIYEAPVGLWVNSDVTESTTVLNDEERDAKDIVKELSEGNTKTKHLATERNRLHEKVDPKKCIDLDRFRDVCNHGSERKRMNDIMNVTRNIDIPTKSIPFFEEKKLITEVLRFEDSFQSRNVIEPKKCSRDAPKAGGRTTKTRPHRGLDRTSCMLLAINLVFIFAFIPFLSLELFKSAKPELVEDMGEISLAIFNLFLKSHLLNSAANPIVYSLCDISFRRECRKFLQKR